MKKSRVNCQKSKVTCQSSNVTEKGFSLLELLVAIFIFVVVVTAASGVFVSAIKGYRNAKAIQRDLEDAQHALNLMAKTIRTSSIISCWNDICGEASGILTDDFIVYDYSQGACVNFSLKNKGIVFKKVNVPVEECNTKTTFDNYGKLIGNVLNDNKFYVITSVNTPTKRVGRVTISLTVCPTADCAGEPKDFAKMQTTVSLRDYSVSGI